MPTDTAGPCGAARSLRASSVKDGNSRTAGIDSTASDTAVAPATHTPAKKPATCLIAWGGQARYHRPAQRVRGDGLARTVQVGGGLHSHRERKRIYPVVTSCAPLRWTRPLRGCTLPVDPCALCSDDEQQAAGPSGAGASAAPKMDLKVSTAPPVRTVATTCQGALLAGAMQGVQRTCAVHKLHTHPSTSARVHARSFAAGGGSSAGAAWPCPCMPQKLWLACRCHAAAGGHPGHGPL